MAIIFGGDCWPIGWRVGFLERPYHDVIDAMRGWDTVERWAAEELPSSDLEARLLRLAPLQTPPKRQLVVPAGERWTAHLMNSLLGGDSVSWVGYLSGVLECQGVIASHIPIGQYPFPSTQFELLGPDGPPPLRYVRTISAGIYDSGRWSFMVSGDPQPFEEPDSYLQRRKRDRFTRLMLIRYLAALGIEADDPGIYGQSGMLFESLSDYTPRTMTLAEARAAYTTADITPPEEFA
jgi:hypothetical protein